MPQFFLVLLKINLVLILFSAAYYLVLRRLTFYSLNRIFLLFGIVFSSAYPFINLTDIFSTHQAVPAFIPNLNQNIKQLVQQHSISVFWQIITALFYVGVMLMATRLLIQFISLRLIHKKSLPGKLQDFNVRLLSEEVSPFSFWQTIYINPALHKAQDLNNILEHEKVHVDEWHTLDIVLAEICLVFYWFNPGVWLMKKAVRENIEFITDAKILIRGVDKKAYQYSLIDVSILRPTVSIVNHFNLSDLKKRIMMMNAKRSSKVNLSRYLLVLPVLLCVTLAFTIDKKNVQETIAPLSKIIKFNIPQSDVDIVSKKPTKVKKLITKPVKKLETGNDSTKKMVFVFKTNFETADTTRESISNELNKLVGQVLDLKTNESADNKAFVRRFRFKDSLKIDQATMGVFLRSSALTQADQTLKGRINNVVLIKAHSEVANDQSGLKAVDVSAKKIDYYIDGNKASGADFNKLDVNQILDIKVVRGDNGEIHIKTKP